MYKYRYVDDWIAVAKHYLASGGFLFDIVTSIPGPHPQKYTCAV
jgi:hypothetical protein